MTKNPFINEREQNVLLGLLVTGLIGVVGGYVFSDRFWFSFLQNSFFVLTLALGAAIFVSVHHVSNAAWTSILRRVPEAMMSYAPIGAISLLLIFFGRNKLYEWTHTTYTARGHALGFKNAWLSTPFFFLRMVAFLAIWCGLIYLIKRASFKQDEDANLKQTSKSKTFSSIFIVLFAITYSFAAFDWVMSLEPTFYSTIFAFYVISGTLLSGVAAITILIILLKQRGYLIEVGDRQLHSLGKLVLGFATFWAYIWLCQYLLIYYANLPEETIYYYRRTSTNGWLFVFLLNVFLNWIIPFVMLLPRKVKMNENWMLTACAIALVGHWVDLYTMVFPSFFGNPMIGFVDVALLLGFVALFLFVFIRNLNVERLIPTGDPYLEESVWQEHFVAFENGAIWSARRKRNLALSTLAFALTFAVWGLIGALAPRFREMYGLSAFQTSVLIAIPVLLGSIGRLPMGILADKYGGRIVMGLLLLFCFIPAFGVSFSGSYASLVVWGFMLGVAGASFSAGVAFTSKWFPAEHQGAALGIYGMGNIGQSIAVFGAPVLVALTGNWRVPFWVMGALVGLFGLIFLWLARDASVSAKPKAVNEYFAILKREPIAWALSLFYFLTFGGFVALGIYLPTLLKDIFGLTPTDAGARVAGFVVVATFMRPVGGWLADKHGGANVLIFVFAILFVLAWGLTTQSMPLFTIGALGSAAALGLGNGAVFKLVPEYFPKETGTVTGLVGAFGGLGGFFPPLVLGIIKSATGSYTLGFVFLSLFALMCLAINYFVFVQRARQEIEAMS
jgi:NNP family nitrate/nitrite transporter-like MFS transporter